MMSQSTSTAEGKYEETPKTTLNELPMELLDIILEKSLLQWMMKSSTEERDEDVIGYLSSVDFCWLQRITRRRFKNRIWRRLKDFYKEKKRMATIIRNNRKYLVENIEPKDEFIEKLLSLNIITTERSRFIRGQFSQREKNAEIVHDMKSFEKTKMSNFVNCLRVNYQQTVAMILENGGVVLKVLVNNCGKTFIDPHRLYEKIEETTTLRKPTKWRSRRADELVSQLKREDVEILNCQPKRRTLVIWIWCRSQEALEHIQMLYESNQLASVFMRLASISQQSNDEVMQSKMIYIENREFKKAVVLCPISVTFTEKIEVVISPFQEDFCGLLTILRNKIYVVCRELSFGPHFIRIFENRSPFHLRKTFQMPGDACLVDIESSDRENCLYFSFSRKNCIWRMKVDNYEIKKWLTIDYKKSTMSMSSGDKLLLVNVSSSSLMMYDSDAKLVHSIQLPRDIKTPIHAVETSVGNFIVLHKSMYIDKKGESGSTLRTRKTKWGICEVTRDGQTVISRFVASTETHELDDPTYLSIDADDRVFVADHANHRVILLHSNLQWNRICCPLTDEYIWPSKLCYDKDKRELMVGAGIGIYGSVYIYSLSHESTYYDRQISPLNACN